MYDYKLDPLFIAAVVLLSKPVDALEFPLSKDPNSLLLEFPKEPKSVVEFEKSPKSLLDRVLAKADKNIELANLLKMFHESCYFESEVNMVSHPATIDSNCAERYHPTVNPEWPSLAQHLA